MPKIIYDDGCCSYLHTAWVMTDQAVQPIQDAFNKCMDAAEALERLGLEAANELYPCNSKNPKRSPNCSWMETQISDILYGIAAADAAGARAAAELACGLALAPALLELRGARSAAWAAYMACRQLQGCGLPAIKPDDTNNPRGGPGARGLD